MPKPSTLTPYVQEQICKMVRAGVPQCHAAASAGIQKRTLTRWKALGREQEEGIYRDFVDALESAHADWVAAMSMVVTKAAHGGDWKAASWALSRREREFQDNSRVQHSGAIGNVNVDSKTLDEATARKLRAQVLGVSVEDVELIERKKFGLG
jgi:hypothetical protein